MAIFPGGPGFAGTRISPFWILLELRMMELVATTRAVECAQIQSNQHHHHQANTQTFWFVGLDDVTATLHIL